MTGLSKKDTFFGIIKLGEHGGFVLDTGIGPARNLSLVTSCALYQPEFKPFTGKRVRIECVRGSTPLLFVEKVSDITVLSPPGKPLAPPKP